ncbi:MAG TPA: Hint domain-containing protein [Phycisphaerales bacterium]|nr:Hint domain-containing protein [Phycisphaerales bacterium]HMP37077.1 Hint domain-containing protein [Phycisphaerales bacterium]
MSSAPGTKYFLYIPVWATTQQPPGSGPGSSESEPTESTESASSVMSSDDPPPSSETGGSSGVGSSGVGSSGGGTSGGGGTETGGTGPGGTGPGGTGPGGTGPGGTGPGGTGPGGSSSGGSSNCLLYGTLVTMGDGRRVPIEMLAPGDLVASLVVPGLKTDVPFGRQYEWMSTWGLAGASLKNARLASVQLGEHDGFFLVNGRIKATFEHPFLIRREHEGQEAWGFCAAELLRVGDVLITHQPGAATDGLAEEPIVTIERIAGRVRTVALCVPGTNTFLADGAWTHNTFGPSILSSTSGSSSSSSGSKSSGSSFSSSSGSPVLTQFTQSSFTFGASSGSVGLTNKG